MGTEIQVKSNLLRHYSMRDLNDNSNICSWPVLPNSHYYNGCLTRSAATAYPVLGRDILKQMMLEHEDIFRKQVLELHRLYMKQKELMNEFKRHDMFKGRMAIETSFASSPLASQITSEDVAKWHSPGVPLVNSSYNLRTFASAVEGIQSRASSARVNCMQAADVPSPNGFGVKSSETLHSTRPSKVRRKMLDLQLPPNQYIDDDEPEQVKGDKFPEILATLPKEDARADHQNGVILTELYSGVRSVTDLKKPLEVDETTGSAHVHLHSQSLAQSSNLGNSNEVASSHSVFASNNGGGWLSILESGEGKGKKSVSQGNQIQKLLVSEASMEQSQLDRSRERRIHELDTAESDNCPESVTSSHFSPRYLFSSPPDPAKSWSNVTNFERQGSYSFNHKMPSQNGLSLETISCSYMKVVQPSGIQGGSDGMLQFQSELPYQNGFHLGSSSSCSWELTSQLRFAAYDHYAYCSEDIALKEGMQYTNDKKHHWRSTSEVRSASRLVDLNATLLSGTSGGLVKAKKMKDCPNIPTRLLVETGFNNDAALRQVDLNAAVLGGPSSGMVNKGKTMEDHPMILPWLKPETGFCSEDHSSSNCDIGRKNVMGRGLEGDKTLSGSIASVSYYDDHKNNSGQCSRGKKIIAFHISEKGASRPSDGMVSDFDSKTRLLDINLPCDLVPELAKPSSPGHFVADKGNDLKVSHCIDLNLAISEDEDSAIPYVPGKTGKRILDIDLEAPAALDEEFGFVYCSEVVEENGEKSSRSVDEGMVSAAEAIVAISATVHYCFSPDKIFFSAGCMEDPLNWFADVTVSCLNNAEMRSASIVSKCKQTWWQDGETTSEDIDDFELMTLKLTGMKSEDYFPKPFVPDIQIEDLSVANPTSSHRRRGQARRGRQRRDFQRDILPGLASLSRHEVREDLQTFGGLMRATGHVWQTGLTRRNSRNGSARGRRRTSAAASVVVSQTTTNYASPPLVQQQSVVEVGLEERSLTSWGKTTRRPRRQRCAMSNSPLSVAVVQS